MKRLEWSLERRGYRVVNLSYPSRSATIEDLALEWLPVALRKADVTGSARVHFVTHSLGGIIVRKYLEDASLPNLGRVVMLAPPNHGSELVDLFGRWPLFRWCTGKAGQQLSTGGDGMPARLGSPNFEIGVIAGDRSLNPLLSACLPGADDGKVSVQSTRLAGMKEHLLVHHSHTWMMWRKDVLLAVETFLEKGTFLRADSARHLRAFPDTRATPGFR